MSQVTLFAGGQEVAAGSSENVVAASDDWSMIAYQRLDGDNWDIYLYYSS